MSGSERDSRSSQPPVTAADDPWAKWRKPEADAAPAESKKPPKPEKVAQANVEAKPEPVVDAPVAKAEGTLGVRRSASAEPGPRKRPVRGGALARKPRTEAPAPEVQRGEAVEKRAPRSQGKETGARAGKWPEKSGEKRGDKQFAKQGTKPAGQGAQTRSPREENPWATSKVNRPVGKPETVRPAPQPVVAGEAPSGVRLSKVMSERGLCSRREADLWIERGWVFVDGEQVSELGSRIDPNAQVEISTEAKKDQAKAVTILLHKPVGYVSGQPEPGMQPAVVLITPEAQLPQSGDPEFKPWMLRGLAPAGRLDVDSTGLLVLTSDGRVAKRLIGEDSQAEKEYLVRVSGEMIKGGLDLLRHGLELDGKPLKPAWVKQLNEDQLHFILKEGKKRQIRRMCELVGLKVIGLKRVRIGRIRLGDLPLGQWRFLREGEAF